MCCCHIAKWGRSSLQSCPIRCSKFSKMLIVILVLTVLQYYIFNIVFKAPKPGTMFNVNVAYFLNHSIQGRSRGFIIPSQINPNFTNFNGNISFFLSTTVNASDKPLLNAYTVVQSSKFEALEMNTTLQDLTLSVTGKTLCPAIPLNLSGPIKVLMKPLSLEELENKFPMLRLGGQYSPTECQARDRVAIIVPYRRRAKNLRILLLNIHPFLQRQKIDYGIYIVEQAGNDPFNRAMLMNIGFVESLKLYDYDCFIFHDVDLLPEDDHNLYTCPEQPRHMSVAVDVLKYKLPYPSIFGGVSAMTKAQFQKVNGFSNQFWGWGGEDDDMSNRVRYNGYYIARYPANVGRYKMLPHPKQPPNPKRHVNIKRGLMRFKTDGLNNLHYKLKELSFCRLFTRILVELATS